MERTALITSVAGRSGATKSNNLWKLKWHLWGSYCCFWVCGTIFLVARRNHWSAVEQPGAKIYAGFHTSTKTRNQLKTESSQKSLSRKNPYQRNSSYRLHTDARLRNCFMSNTYLSHGPSNEPFRQNFFSQYYHLCPIPESQGYFNFYVILSDSCAGVFFSFSFCTFWFLFNDLAFLCQVE